MSKSTEEKKNEEKQKTDWFSISIGALITFLLAGQITLYMSSLWPYLIELLKSEANSTIYACIVASNPFFVAVTSPLYGFWANHIDNTKIPAVVGILLMCAGHTIYLLLPLHLAHPYAVMFAGRAINGIGAGVASVLRSHSIACSTQSDRSRAVSLNTGAFALGLTCGPAFQLCSIYLSYPGVQIVGDLRLSLYNGPALAGVFISLCSLMLLFVGYKDSKADAYRASDSVLDEHRRFVALPKFDRVAALVIIYTRFMQFSVFTTIESIGTLYAMNMFAWCKETAVYWLSGMSLATGILEFLVQSLNTLFNIGSWADQRIGCIVGKCLMILFILITFPWWGLPGHLVIEADSPGPSNSTASTGCSRNYSWCTTTPPVSPVLFIGSFIVLISAAMAIITTTTSTIYSKIIGPRNQGTMQGFIVLAGCSSRLGGIILVPLFVSAGPRPTWLVMLASLCSCVLAWLFFYRRLVPLKLPSERPSGDVYRTKHGRVYKF